MQCPKCQFENPPEAKFCGRCGETLKTVPPPPPPPPPVSGVTPELKIGIAIGSAIIPLVGIIMGAIYMNDPNPEKKKAGKLWLFIGLGAMALWCLLCGMVSAMSGSHQNYGYGY